MKPRNVIVWILLLGIVVLTMSTSVQAKELTEVNATDILEQIENGEDIHYENVSITGELNISEIKLETVPIERSDWQIVYDDLEGLKIVETNITIELKIVETYITITNSVFENDVDFSNTQFRKPLDFLGSYFSGKTDFNGASFFERARFVKTNFSGTANFRDANFSNWVWFFNACFSGVANFNEANFNDDADFIMTKFRDAACFEGAKFNDDAHFIMTKFNDEAIFGFAKFNDDAHFGDAKFNDDAHFGDANFSGNTSFKGSEFNKVYFSNTVFNTIVSFNETYFNRMKVEWSSLEDALVFDGPTYIKLIKNFREIEQFEDADAAYYQYRRLSQANKEWSYSKLMDVVAGASCGYGVKPERPLIWAFGLIMVFTLVYWRGKGIKRLKENDGDKNRVSRWAAFYNSFYFSVVTFTTVGYGDWYPEDRYRIVVMIEGVLGWLLLALFIVTLANVMIRP